MMKDSFITVGIGYSAGGLAAVESFFENIPARSGLAFVVVHHMPRGYKSHLKHILPEHTTIPLVSITDSILVQPNHIYVLDENQYVKMWDNHLYFIERPEHTEVSTVIDTLFFSMASEKKEKVVGVILSGNGSDGARGGLAIQKAGGKLLVQEPASAEFNLMPINAIGANDPFFVGTPKQLAEGLIRFTRKRS